ncbi:hypothetical protein ACFW04_012027 [Cataglyphis niger]
MMHVRECHVPTNSPIHFAAKAHGTTPFESRDRECATAKKKKKKKKKKNRIACTKRRPSAIPLSCPGAPDRQCKPK